MEKKLNWVYNVSGRVTKESNSVTKFMCMNTRL